MAITRITMFDVGKPRRFQTPWELCIVCDTQTHTSVELLLTGGTASTGKKDLVSLRKQLLCPVQLQTWWESRSAAAAHGAATGTGPPRLSFLQDFTGSSNCLWYL